MSDMWSIGVIMYVMLCGYPPFFGETDADVLAEVRLGNFSFNAADWKNPRDRYTAEPTLNHAWIKEKATKA